MNSQNMKTCETKTVWRYQDYYVVWPAQKHGSILTSEAVVWFWGDDVDPSIPPLYIVIYSSGCLKDAIGSVAL